VCVVPKLKGTTLATARKRLKHALCRLGKVTKPRHPHSGLVVTRQNPSAGKRLPVNTRVKLKLGAKHQ
jgi:beta-lactam-binding protein with PASTA domain